jgi:ParB family transcriptional regulator, chromosome partitioning protein
MKASLPKIILSRSQDIPFNKLILSQANVRRIKAGISVEELAEDIARRGLLQGLSVRAVHDADGAETGMYEIPAGGRRYRALELLVKQKRMAKTQPVPCVVRTEGLAEEDSLAENVQRVALHPLDQFRAFQTLRDKGLGEEDIAARYFVSVPVVKQRLKLAAVSPKLLDLYAEDAMTLEQLMAFTVTDDHARQEQVWDAVTRSYNKGPYIIRRQLTEGAVGASDKRALFVGLDVYEAAGGVITRDLFADDDGGWLQDPALLDRLVTARLAREADALRHEGWKWIAAAADFPFGHSSGMRRLVGETAPLSDTEQAACDALHAEFDELQEAHATSDDLPEEVDARLGEIEAALEAFDKPDSFDPAATANAGVFVSIGPDGELRVERGYVRPEDAAACVTEPDSEAGEGADLPAAPRTTVIMVGGTSADADDTGAEEDGIKPLPDRLVVELTAYRTLALREALANDPDIAFVAVLHALCLAAFYRYGTCTCLEITAKSTGFGVQSPGLNDTALAKAINERHEQWAKRLPKNTAALWDALLDLSNHDRTWLFAHCASVTINAVHEAWNRTPGRDVHANQLARSVGLDVIAAGWAPTVENYLGRVTKARILEAVREAKGEASAQLIDHLKKPDMAKEAERLLAGCGWLPEPLRMSGAEAEADSQSANPGSSPGQAYDGEALPAFLAENASEDPAPEPLHAFAAE